MRAILLATLLLTACTTAAGAPAPTPAADLPPRIGEDLAQRDVALREPGVVAAAINGTADLGAGLRVRPLEVLEDSRCPQNARCVWAGQLRVRINVEGVGEREVILGEGVVETPRGDFSMVAATPGPWTDWPEGAKPPYRFGFRRA